MSVYDAVRTESVQPMLSQGSILSFPDRGPWGNPRYRGNCSGYVYQRIFEQLRPRVFTDPMVGSGTSIDVAREMGIEAYGLDLHSGFNILKDSILETVGKPSDLVLSHPPYHDCIVYSGSVWGRAPHPDDLSRSLTAEFMDKLYIALLNQRTATAIGGHYGFIIGDVRRGGCYFSPQAEIIARMPRDELRSVLIKAQHKVASSHVRLAACRGPPNGAFLPYAPTGPPAAGDRPPLGCHRLRTSLIVSPEAVTTGPG